MVKVNLKLEKIINFIKKPTVILFGVLIYILSSLITITDGYFVLRNIVNDSVLHKQILYNKIDKLTTETNIKYFESILGEPVYINKFEKKKLKEFIFVDEAFFIQTITDNNDKVLAYSVTIRKEDFYPKVPMRQLWLGKSTFVDVKKVFDLDYKNTGGPDWIISGIGFHDYFYSEGYYLGNPGGYQTLGLSMSMVGALDEDGVDLTDIPGSYISPNVGFSFSEEIDYQVSHMSSDKYPDEVRKFLNNNKNIINTYTIFGPMVSTGDIIGIRESPITYLLGPDQNQVRLLNYK